MGRPAFPGADRRAAGVLRAQVVRAAQARIPVEPARASHLSFPRRGGEGDLCGIQTGQARPRRGNRRVRFRVRRRRGRANGVGKSTLLKCLAGVKKEELGHVRFRGEVVPFKKRHEHAFLVMQDPDYQLFRPSVLDELASAAPSSFDPDEPRLKAVLEAFGLGDVADRHPASLSGGQKQRCVCAIASESGAQALLLDEPTSGLDFRNMERLALIRRAEASRGKTVAVVSHDTEFLSKACDQIVLIE